MNDYMTLKALEKDGFSPYEQVKIGHMQSKKASGTAIAGLTVAVGAGAAAIGVGLYACAKASEARRTAAAENAGTAALLKQATEFALGQIREERQERREGDLNITTTINDTVSGQQSGQLSQSQQLSNELTLGLMTGKYSENPIKVVRVSGQRECGCDSCS